MKNSIFDNIKTCTKQFYKVAKISKDLKYCAELAISQYINVKELCIMCSVFGISKQEYVDRIVLEVQEVLHNEKEKEEARVYGCNNCSGDSR